MIFSLLVPPQTSGLYMMLAVGAVGLVFETFVVNPQSDAKFAIIRSSATAQCRPNRALFLQEDSSYLQGFNKSKLGFVDNTSLQEVFACVDRGNKIVNLNLVSEK